jgi:hypothetical protein
MAEQPLEGEGSYIGTRKYQKGVHDQVKKGKVGEAARKAKEAVGDEAERERLKQAEEEGKKRSKTRVRSG